MKPSECIDLFRGEYYFLSNFYPAKLMFDGIAYCNSESAYQAQKLADREARRNFSRLYADEAKRLGQKVEVRQDWDDIKTGMMAEILYAKFTQTPRLGRLLAETGDIPLIEGNKWGDTYWGVDLRTHEGENRLGKLLTELRARLRAQGVPDNSALRPVRRLGPIDGITVTEDYIEETDADVAVTEADGLPVGTTVIACSGSAEAKAVIHSATPVYGRDDENLLARCYVSCLESVKNQGLRSAAFPVMAAEKHCFPNRKAAHIAVNAVHSWLNENGSSEIRVIFSCPDHRMYDMVCDALEG